MRYEIGDTVTLNSDYTYQNLAGETHTISKGTSGKVIAVFPTPIAYRIAFLEHGTVRLTEQRLE